MRLNENLVNLLKDLEGRVDEADKKVINEALQDVRTPCLPSHAQFMTWEKI